MAKATCHVYVVEGKRPSEVAVPAYAHFNKEGVTSAKTLLNLADGRCH